MQCGEMKEGVGGGQKEFYRVEKGVWSVGIRVLGVGIGMVLFGVGGL